MTDLHDKEKGKIKIMRGGGNGVYSKNNGAVLIKNIYIQQELCECGHTKEMHNMPIMCACSFKYCFCDKFVPDSQLPPTQEKTMEYEAIVRIIANMAFGFNGSDKTNPPMVGLKYAVETLKETLASSQDSFRRKVEEEKVNALKKLQNRYKDVQSVLEEDEIPNYMGILELEIEEAKQRAKLINIK